MNFKTVNTFVILHWPIFLHTNMKDKNLKSK